MILSLNHQNNGLWKRENIHCIFKKINNLEKITNMKEITIFDVDINSFALVLLLKLEK